MTPAQEDRLLGYEESLARRHFMVTVGGAGPVRALVQPLEPESGEFNLGNNEREYSNVEILRDELAGIHYETGTYIEDAVNQRRHRVSRIVDHPTSIAIRFISETVPVEM
jgi:hypothetical protein